MSLATTCQRCRVLRRRSGIEEAVFAHVRKAHDRGFWVDVWTIDEEAAMRRLLSFGVDGIMTDRPDVLTGVLEKSAR
jgi:glycerophosphoryl diester phosphodiesterase